jgi:membrane protein DedA with SNARE-associated domain
MEEMLKAIPVVLSSMLKFILGPLEGYALRLHFLVTYGSTVLGMMISVLVVSFFGDWLRHTVLKKYFEKREQHPPTGKFTTMFLKYGLGGIAFLTPLFLTPIGGTILALGLGKPRRKIVLYMLISAAIWGFIFTGIVYLIGHKVLPDFIK